MRAVSERSDSSLTVKPCAFKISPLFSYPFSGESIEMKSSLILTLAVLSSSLVIGSNVGTAADVAARREFTPEERGYWAFQPVARPKVPAVRDGRWVRNPIDAFILSELEGKGLRPSAPADRTTLLRRLTLDLIGL